MLIEAGELLRLSSIEIGNRDYIKAISYIDDAIKILCQEPMFNSTLAILYRQKSFCYRRLGENTEAEVCIKLSLVADPKYGQAYFDLGFLQGYAKQYDEAIINFQKAIEYKCEDPILPQVYFILSTAYYKKSLEMHGDNDLEIAAKKAVLQKALNAIQKALKIESNNIDYCLLAGKICLWLDSHFDTDDFSNTIHYLTMASNLGSQEARDLLHDLDFSKHMPTNKDDGLTYLYSGNSKAEKKDYEGAIADFEKALEHRLEIPELLFINIASCHNAIAQRILQNNGNTFGDIVGASRDAIILESQMAYNSIIKALESTHLNDIQTMQCNLLAGMTSFRINMFCKSAKDLPSTLKYLKKAADLGSQEAIPLLEELTRIIQETSR